MDWKVALGGPLSADGRRNGLVERLLGYLFAAIGAGITLGIVYLFVYGLP